MSALSAESALFFCWASRLVLGRQELCTRQRRVREQEGVLSSTAAMEVWVLFIISTGALGAVFLPSVCACVHVHGGRVRAILAQRVRCLVQCSQQQKRHWPAPNVRGSTGSVPRSQCHLLGTS